MTVVKSGNMLGVDRETHIEYHNRSRVTKYGVKVVDGVTICCGYDLGNHHRRANYCPVCGKEIVERKYVVWKG